MPYRTWYKPGDHNVLDDLSGFRLKHSQTRVIPGGQTGGALVDKKRWEPQHPQDFVRGVADDQTIIEARPRQPNRFVIVGSWVVAPSAKSSRTIQLASAEGFLTNHKVSVMLDSGEPYYPVIIRIAGNTLTLTPRLPWGVGGNYGSPLENSVIDLGPYDGPPFLVDDAGPFITDDYGNYIALP